MFKGNIEKIIGFLLIGLLTFNFFYLIHIGNAINHRSDQFDKKIVELNTQINNIQDKTIDARDKKDNEAIDFLKEEYSNYRDFANSDREGFFNLVSLFFVALGVLVTGGTIVLYWIFGQTKTEVKENANLTIRASIDEIEQDAKDKIKSLIDPKIEDYEKKYKELERFIENQHSIRKSRVLVLCPDSKKEEMEKLEVMRIRGIVGEAQLMDLNDFKAFKQKVINGEVDIIVYRYEKNNGQQEESVRKYIQLLKDLDLEIPVVIYANFNNRVDGEDSVTINSYPFSVIANLPTSLTSNMISLANVLSYERR
ncbi:hypothetical protein QUF79_00880 [Fictibacillus enclensis]|uniref:hypothetical protein n=1 Tax=Fictibacillus enclensis TaxID=1017270 RepID=UPI0025A279D5|nr:hypothetical protein [Fictibacillus enclensis]MDM5196642.1 hypothetical protein [Fictibacillus enclensis]